MASAGDAEREGAPEAADAAVEETVQKALQLGQELGLPPSLMEAMQAFELKFGSAATAKLFGGREALEGCLPAPSQIAGPRHSETEGSARVRHR